MSATSSTRRALVTMQTNRHTHAFLLLFWCLMNTGPKQSMPAFEKGETLVILDLGRGGI